MYAPIAEKWWKVEEVRAESSRQDDRRSHPGEQMRAIATACWHHSPYCSMTPVPVSRAVWWDHLFGRLLAPILSQFYWQSSMPDGVAVPFDLLGIAIYESRLHGHMGTCTCIRYYEFYLVYTQHLYGLPRSLHNRLRTIVLPLNIPFLLEDDLNHGPYHIGRNIGHPSV